MDLRNRYVLLALRTLFGLALLLIGVMGLFMAPPTEGISPAAAAALQGLASLGISQIIAVIEIIAGLLIISGFLPALGALLAAPISVGIVAFHAAREPGTILPGIIFGLLNLYLGYAYWDKFKALFQR